MSTAHVVRSTPVTGLAALLLTGGRSSRMGHDKATLELDGIPQAVRLAVLLREIAAPVIEIGPGRSGLPYVEEEPRGEGPLVAIAAGADALLAAGHAGPALVIACDLPLLDAEALRLLATYPGDTTVLPLVDGHEQPLCARWSGDDLAAARRGAREGERSLRRLPLRDGAVLLDADVWGAVTSSSVFADTDTPADLAALGLTARVRFADPERPADRRVERAR